MKPKLTFEKVFTKKNASRNYFAIPKLVISRQNTSNIPTQNNQDKNMLEYLKCLFRREFQLSTLSFITIRLAEILATLTSDYLSHPKSKDQAIDAIIKILEDQKDANQK